MTDLHLRRCSTVTATVEQITDERPGPSGHPLAPGWWWSLVIDGHRQRGVCQNESSAWAAACSEINGPWARKLMGRND